jgi:phage tail sheath gpL-like
MASPNVSFTQIPANVRKPGVYLEENTSNALQGLSAVNDKVVILAQKTASGAVASKTPTKVFSDADAALNFGQGSIAHLTAKAALQANANLDLTVVGIDDNGSTKAVGNIIVTGQAGVAGALVVYVGDQAVSVNIDAGWTAAQGATAIYGAIANAQNQMPITAGVTGASAVNFTARNAGTLGNQIPLTASVVAGLTGMAFAVTEPAGGSTDPDLGAYDTASTVLNSIVGGGYSIIINTLNDNTNMGKVKNMVEFVSGPMEQRPAIQVVGVTDQVDTFGNIETKAGTTMNHGRTTMAYLRSANGNLAKTEPFKIAGEYGAMLAYNSDPVVPYDGLTLATVAAPAVTDRFTRTEQESLLNNGVTPLYVIPGEMVAIVRAVSTYTVNSFGTPDPTLLDINTLRTLDYVRAQVLLRLQQRFQRAKLSTKTPGRVRSETLDVLYLLEQLEIVQNVKQYASGVICERDSADVNRIDIKIPTNIVSGLHVIAGVLDLIL